MTDQQIDEAIQGIALEPEGSEPEPAIIVMPPDSGEFIHGNRAGFLRLAVAALRAAKGETQSFQDEDWVADHEMDWGVLGFKYDALAHMDLPPPKPTGWHKLRGQLLGYGMLGSILAVFVVGFITSIDWIEHLFTHH